MWHTLNMIEASLSYAPNMPKRCQKPISAQAPEERPSRLPGRHGAMRTTCTVSGDPKSSEAEVTSALLRLPLLPERLLDRILRSGSTDAASLHARRCRCGSLARQLHVIACLFNGASNQQMLDRVHWIQIQCSEAIKRCLMLSSRGHSSALEAAAAASRVCRLTANSERHESQGCFRPHARIGRG